MAKGQLSLAKITPPRVSGILPRARLFRALDKKRSHPLIWISGPAGSGKTTLVASYLQARKIPCLWYRTDEGDGDLATFFYYLGLGGKKVAPRIRKPLPLLTPEYLQGIPVFALRFLEDLFCRLGRPACLVFDNYHSVPLGSLFHEVMSEAFSAIPDGINVIAVSRQALPPALTGLHANGLVSLLGWEDLRLTLDETSRVVGLRNRELRSKKLIGQLHSATNGWIAGLVLMLESLKQMILTSHDNLSREEIFAYFGGQFFFKLEPELRNFLTRTAFLPRITVKMAEELTGLPHAVDLLARLARDNNFTERQSSPEPVYRYHQLLREFLMERARADLASPDLAALIVQSAHLLEESGAVEEAAQLLLKTGDIGDMTRFVLAHAPALMAQGRHKVISEWLAAFPPEAVEASPWLLYWKGTCLMPEAPLQSTAYFEMAFRLFEEQHNDPGTLLAWSGAVDSILFAWDNFSPLHSWFEWLDCWLRDNRHFPSLEIEARVAVSVSGMFAWTIPSRPDTKEWMERALRLSRETGDISLQLQALTHSLMYFAWIGEIGFIRPAVEQARSIAHSHSASPLSLIVWKVAESRARLFLRTEPEASLELLRKGIELAEKSGIRIFDNFLYGLAAGEALSKGDIVQAEDFLRKMEAIAPRTPRALSNHCQLTAGWIHFLRGNLDRALALAEEALQVSLECDVPFSEIAIRQFTAKVLNGRREYEEALDQVSVVKELISRMGGSPLFAYLTLLDEAHFLSDEGKDKRALEALCSALAIGKAHDYKTLAWHWQPAVLAGLCAKALENDIETAYVQDLIRSLKLVPDSPPLGIESWPWPIRIYTLGRFELQRNGIPVEFSGKAQRKPLELLKALLAHGGQAVRGDVIADALWPEAMGDAAHHSFEVTLQRLRVLLGHPQALQLRDGRLTLDTHYCWVDLWAFDHLVDQVKTGKSPDRACRAAQKAVGIYTGLFLADETDEPWVTHLRERLRSRFLTCIKWLGHYCEQTGRWEEALQYYQKGLEVDNLAEELYRLLMTCQFRLGRKGEALSTYMRCKSTLSLLLGTTPSAETERLYRTIKGQL